MRLIYKFVDGQTYMLYGAEISQLFFNGASIPSAADALDAAIRDARPCWLINEGSHTAYNLAQAVSVHVAE